MSPQRHPRPAPSEVEQYRSAFLQHIPTLQAAANDVRSALDDAQNAYRLVGEHVAAGGALSELEAIIKPIPLRSTLATSLENLERARHRGQCLMFQLLFAEGNSMADIANSWGISRQLVSRLLNEPL